MRRTVTAYCCGFDFDLQLCRNTRCSVCARTRIYAQIGLALPMDSAEAAEENCKPDGKTLLYVLGPGSGPALCFLPNSHTLYSLNATIQVALYDYVPSDHCSVF